VIEINKKQLIDQFRENLNQLEDSDDIVLCFLDKMDMSHKLQVCLECAIIETEQQEV
jgi:hypothetical protein